MLSAISEFDGLKLRDKTKFDQSAGLLGTMEIERLRYAAEQAVGIQARP